MSTGAAVEGYEISAAPARLDLDVIHGSLSEHSYWSAGISRASVERAITHPLAFGIYRDGAQLGFHPLARP